MLGYILGRAFGSIEGILKKRFAKHAPEAIIKKPGRSQTCQVFLWLEIKRRRAGDLHRAVGVNHQAQVELQEAIIGQLAEPRN